tara:strand:- start:3108 stop:3947 length:840 start_codon:yes stop_codon:yes gene_type:complete
MKIIRSEKEMISHCNELKSRTSFIPTMGSLHDGHVKLLVEGKKYSNYLISSLFINPLQFNNQKDLVNYPKNYENDISIFEKSGVDLLYFPNENEILNSNLKKINSGLNGKILEGKYRPGHFDGVLTIVNKFFEIIKPDYSLFGIKDFQQLCLIYTKLSPIHKTTIIPVETVREDSGLACSSRNKLLNHDQKVLASRIYEGLKLLEEIIKEKPRIDCIAFLKDFYSNFKYLDIEYVLLEKTSIFDENEKYILDLFQNKNIVIMVAAKVGNVRLIDNLLIS